MYGSHYGKMVSPGNTLGIDNVSVTATPEPGTLALLLTAGLGLLGYVWRRRRS